MWAIAWQAITYPWEPALLFWRTNLYLWGMRSTPPVQKGSVWARHVGGDVRHTPAIAHNLVYVTAAPGQVVALDAATGIAGSRGGITTRRKRAVTGSRPPTSTRSTAT